MLILGLVLLLVGWFVGVQLLVTLGIVLLIVGFALLLLGASGHAVGGRNWY